MCQPVRFFSVFLSFNNEHLLFFPFHFFSSFFEKLICVFDFGFVEWGMIAEVLINIQSDRKDLSLPFVLRKVLIVNALGPLKPWEKRLLKLMPVAEYCLRSQWQGELQRWLEGELFIRLLNRTWKENYFISDMIILFQQIKSWNMHYKKLYKSSSLVTSKC